MKLIYAIDFDGTLCENKYPQIGEPIQRIINFVKQVKAEGNSIIFWSCRTGENLKNALEWCEQKGIIFDAINEQLPEILDSYELDSRKIYADFYIDDKNLFTGIEVRENESIVCM